MACNIDHIVGSAQYEIVAIFIPNPPIEGGIDLFAWNAGPIGFNKPRIILPDCLHAPRRQRPLNGDHPFLMGFDQLLTGVFVKQFDVVAIHGYARAAKFGGQIFNPMGHGEDWPACFRLPIVVDDGFAQAA